MKNKIKTSLSVAFILFLTGCATVEPISVSGRNLTYEHGIGKSAVAEVYVDADKQCKKTRNDSTFSCFYMSIPLCNKFYL